MNSHGWHTEEPQVGQVARVWFFTEMVTATWSGHYWETECGCLPALPFWWQPCKRA